MLSWKNYRDGNFIHVINFEKLGITDGILQIRMKFARAKDEPMVLVWVPMVERNIVFENSGEVHVD